MVYNIELECSKPVTDLKYTKFREDSIYLEQFIVLSS